MEVLCLCKQFSFCDPQDHKKRGFKYVAAAADAARCDESVGALCSQLIRTQLDF